MTGFDNIVCYFRCRRKTAYAKPVNVTEAFLHTALHYRTVFSNLIAKADKLFSKWLLYTNNANLKIFWRKIEKNIFLPQKKCKNSHMACALS